MPTDAFNDLIDTFSFLEDWEDRYRHVIDMGKSLPPMDPALKVPATKVEGCASQVWLHPTFSGADHALSFDGDSDAIIVKGLIAVLHDLFAGLPARDVVAIDAQAELGKLGLADHLSAQRSNGVRAMVMTLQSRAREQIG